MYGVYRSGGRLGELTKLPVYISQDKKDALEKPADGVIGLLRVTILTTGLNTLLGKLKRNTEDGVEAEIKCWKC